MDSRATIVVDGQTFDCEANDLKTLCVLGRGAYGVVEKVQHRPSNTILAVKVSSAMSSVTTKLYMQ